MPAYKEALLEKTDLDSPMQPTSAPDDYKQPPSRPRSTALPLRPGFRPSPCPHTVGLPQIQMGLTV